MKVLYHPGSWKKNLQFTLTDDAPICLTVFQGDIVKKKLKRSVSLHINVINWSLIVPPYYQGNHDLITVVATLTEDAFIKVTYACIWSIKFWKENLLFPRINSAPSVNVVPFFFNCMNLQDDSCSDASAFLANYFT